MLDILIFILLLTPLALPMVTLGLPMVPSVPTLTPMVPLAPLAAEKRSGFSGYQWYHWLPMVPLVKFPMVPLGESRTHASLGLPTVILELPMVPLVPTLPPMVTLAPIVPLAAEKRSGFSGHQGYHWPPMLPLVKFPMVPLGESRTHALSLSFQLVLLRPKKGFDRFIGYLNFINDRTKLVSSQALAHVQLRILSKGLTSCLTAIKNHWIKITILWKKNNNFWSIKNSAEILNKLKAKCFQASTFSTYTVFALFSAHAPISAPQGHF